MKSLAHNRKYEYCKRKEEDMYSSNFRKEELLNPRKKEIQVFIDK